MDMTNYLITYFLSFIMAELTIKSDILKTKVGKIDGAKEAITINDYLRIASSTSFFGRLFTLLDLYFIQKKGWLNTENAEKIMGRINYSDLIKISQSCQNILNN